MFGHKGVIVLMGHDFTHVAGHGRNETCKYFIEVFEIFAVDDEPLAHRKRVELLLLEDVHVLKAVVVDFPSHSQVVVAFLSVQKFVKLMRPMKMRRNFECGSTNS